MRRSSARSSSPSPSSSFSPPPRPPPPSPHYNYYYALQPTRQRFPPSFNPTYNHQQSPSLPGSAALIDPRSPASVLLQTAVAAAAATVTAGSGNDRQVLQLQLRSRSQYELRQWNSQPRRPRFFLVVFGTLQWHRAAASLVALPNAAALCRKCCSLLPLVSSGRLGWCRFRQSFFAPVVTSEFSPKFVQRSCLVASRNCNPHYISVFPTSVVAKDLRGRALLGPYHDTSLSCLQPMPQQSRLYSFHKVYVFICCLPLIVH